MDTPGILISGASIAGPAAAWWPAAAGWEVTVVERVGRPVHLRPDNVGTTAPPVGTISLPDHPLRSRS